MEVSDVLGGIARDSEITARAAVKRATTGPWNKWRGPASSRGGSRLCRESPLAGALTASTA